MCNIPRLRDVYHDAFLRFEQFLNAKRLGELRAATPEGLLAEFLKKEHLALVTLELDESRTPELNRSSAGDTLCVFFKPERTDSFEILGKVYPSKWSSDFEPQKVVCFRPTGGVLHPTSATEDGVLRTRESIVSYVEGISSEIRDQAPRFLSKLAERASHAVSSAQADAENNTALAAKTGFKVIDAR